VIGFEPERPNDPLPTLSRCCLHSCRTTSLPSGLAFELGQARVSSRQVWLAAQLHDSLLSQYAFPSLQELHWELDPLQLSGSSGRLDVYARSLISNWTRLAETSGRFRTRFHFGEEPPRGRLFLRGAVVLALIHRLGPSLTPVTWDLQGTVLGFRGRALDSSSCCTWCFPSGVEIVWGDVAIWSHRHDPTSLAPLLQSVHVPPPAKLTLFSVSERHTKAKGTIDA
jgi:hypothetical protein